ncbi:MAG TPA: hemerythrin domain-containing protein [Marmoricola sp.]|nr:hemerythrin domain-containing protein [Marmoricola sp.]
MSADADRDTELLLEVRRRRAELRSSMSVLEHALASPTRAGGGAGWSGRLGDALRGLYDDFGQHVEITEGPDGLYAELAQHSPRLEHAVIRLVEEHGEIMRRLEELLAWTDVEQGADAVEARRAGTELLGVLMRHRQRGADLIFEAFQLDIGGET